MKFSGSLFFCTLMLAAAMNAQQAATSVTVVPRLVNFSGKAIDGGKTITGVAGATFAIYSEQSGGSALWLETQNIQADAKGNYVVQLGATKPEGLPLDLFTSGEARWLGVTINGGEEQPRILLLSVPYALKAADAETIGGLPASAFALASAPNPASSVKPNGVSGTANASSRASSDVTTTGGTANTLPLFTTATNVQNSILTQTGSGTTGKIGFNTTTPATLLDVNGGATVRGTLALASTGTATATTGKNSQPLAFTASSYNSSTAAAVVQKFQWQAEPAANDTTAPSGTMNLLYGSGTATPAETGLKINSKGQITFATGQTFPGGGGTITDVKAGTDLTGGGTSGTVTLNLNTSLVPTLAATNLFTGNNTFSMSGATDAVDAYTSGSGKSALVGVQSATSGGSYGVYAETFDATGAGVAGINNNTSQAGGIGVYGQSSDTGLGVYGQIGSKSTAGQDFIGCCAGLWGDGGTGGGAGLLASADDNNAADFQNNSPTGYGTVIIDAFNTGTPPLIAYGTAGNCAVDYQGDLSCTGSKNAVVPVDGGKRIVAMSAIESPKNWFEDFGSAQLTNGAAVVALDSTFTQTVNTNMEYQVFLTPYGDCKGLYVSNRTAQSFEVHELGGGSASLNFGYRISAVRRNYENVRFADHTHDLDASNRLRERMKRSGAKSISHDLTPKGLVRSATLAKGSSK